MYLRIEYHDELVKSALSLLDCKRINYPCGVLGLSDEAHGRKEKEKISSL